MISKILDEVRAVSPSLGNAIICPIVVDGAKKLVRIKLITDKVYTQSDKARVGTVLQKYIPQYFGCEVEIEKLTPDCAMIERKIIEIIGAASKPVHATLKAGDVAVEKTANGFSFTIAAPTEFSAGLAEKVCEALRLSFCGEFEGKCVPVGLNVDDIEIEETADDIEFEMPVRTFPIRDFEFIEGDKVQKNAV